MSTTNRYSGFNDDGDGEDLETQHSPSMATSLPWKNPWRMVFLMLSARENFIAKSREISSPPSYSRIATSDTDHDDDATSSNCHGPHGGEDDLEAQNSPSKRSLSLVEISSIRDPSIGTSDTDGHQDSGPKGTVRSSPPSSQISVDVQGIAEARGSDSNQGIQGDAWDHHSPSSTPFLQTKPTTITFVWCLLRACSSYMIVFLFIYLALSIFYWIKKVGVEAGLCVGFVIFVAIIILLVVHALRAYVQQTKQLEKGFLMGVTATGMNSQLGPAHNCKTPLQAQLDKLFTWSEALGLLISILMLVEMLVRLLIQKERDNPGLPPFKARPSTFKDLMDKINRIDVQAIGKIRIFTTAYNILLVGILEGIPLVITLSLVYWNKKMLSGKGYVQGSLACVNMGSVTTICIDKLTGKKLTHVQVERFRIGEEDINGESVIAQNVQDALCDGIYRLVLEPNNSSSSETEGILSWAELNLGMKQDCLKQSCALVETDELNSNEERSLVLMRKNVENETVTCLHRNGPATTILARCSSYYDSQGGINHLKFGKRMYFDKFIEENESKHLKTIAFAYSKAYESSGEHKLILIGLLGLKDTDWTETREAVEACRNGGINTIMVSQDNTQALEAIARQCELLGPSSLVLDASEFRNYNKERMMERVDQISIIGNSLPSDRVVLLEYLKQKGQTVAVIGARENETSSLTRTHSYVGTVETWSSKMVKGTCDMVIFDDNFSFLETIMRNGRCASENIQKYIQYELTMVTSGLLISLLSTGLKGDNPLTTIQLQLGSLVVLTLGGSALSLEPPAEKLSGNQLAGQGGKLITRAMYRNIITQVNYQVAILVVISQFEGKPILGMGPKVNKSLVFNSYILCQVFNLFNCRKLEKKNIFEGINKNPYLWVAAVVMMGLQAAVIAIEPLVGGSPRLNGEQWRACLLIGMVSWMIDYVGKSASGITISCRLGKEFPQFLLRQKPRTLVVSQMEEGGSQALPLVYMPRVESKQVSNRVNSIIPRFDSYMQ